MSSDQKKEEVGDTIAGVGLQCAQAFTRTNLEEFATEEAREDFIDQLGRFKLFAGNIGMFADGMASTDYRLQDDKYLRDVLISMLKQLTIEIKVLRPGILESISENDPRLDQRSASEPSRSSIDSSTSSSIDSSAETDSQFGIEQSIYENKKDTISGIRDLMDRLYRLSTMIRAPNTLSEDIRVAKFAEKNKDTLVANDYVSFVKWQVQRLCPETTDELIGRLSKAVIRRREKLLYREKHSQKLSQGVEISFAKKEPVPFGKQEVDKIPVVRFKEPSKHEPKEDQNVKIDAATLLSGTKASTAIPTQRSYAKSKAITGITMSAIARRSHLDVPPPPKAQNGQEVKCPYCPRLLRPPELRKENWVRHIIKDIDPYICLFEACDQPESCFRSAEEWLQHIRFQHTIVWSCTQKNHPKVVVETKDEFRRHLESEHSDMQIADQLDFITEKSATPADDTFETLARRRQSIIKLSNKQALCPLCAFDPSKDSEDSDTESSSFKRILDHIVGHLESIALLSLPEREGSEDEVSTDTEEVDMREKEDLPSPLFEDIIGAHEKPLELEGHTKTFEDGGIIDGTDLQLTNNLMWEILWEVKDQSPDLNEEDETLHRLSRNFQRRQYNDITFLTTETRRNSDLPLGSHGSSTFPLIQSNPNKNEKPQTLFKQLEDAEEYIAKPYFARIIPRGQLEAILTFEAVADDMALNYPGLEKESIDKYARKVVKEAKKLYAILVLIHQGSIIRQVLDEKIFDTDLPLIYHKPKKRPKQEPSFLGTNQGPVKSFESWSDKFKASFAEVQWRMLAKVFCLGGDYELDENDLLPFMPLEEGEDVRKQGAYGKVYPVRIFPSHHEFKLNDPQALVAVKELFSSDETEFKKEVDVLRMLGSRTSHPNLIKLLATFKQGTQYHLIFPWAHGNLRKYWQDYPNPEFETQTVIWFMEQMAGLTGALKRVHNCRLSFPRDVRGSGASGVRMTDNEKFSVEKGEEKFGRHGDIKPENILYFAESSHNYHSTYILKLADFGLGRFHDRDSRSGLSSSGIRSSPTYEPPECYLRKSVSRSYDIWSLGCVFLEFVTWLMKGGTEIDEFAEFRGTTNVYGIDDDNFFTILYPDSQTLDAKVRPQVENWVLQLHQHEKCSELIHNLLDTIMTRLLLIEAKDRISITELDELMQGYLNKAKDYPIYLLKGVPYPSTYPPENIKNL